MLRIWIRWGKNVGRTVDLSKIVDQVRFCSSLLNLLSGIEAFAMILDHLSSHAPGSELLL
jgi:hypothetical protein